MFDRKSWFNVKCKFSINRWNPKTCAHYLIWRESISPFSKEMLIWGILWWFFILGVSFCVILPHQVKHFIPVSDFLRQEGSNKIRNQRITVTPPITIRKGPNSRRWDDLNPFLPSPKAIKIIPSVTPANPKYSSKFKQEFCSLREACCCTLDCSCRCILVFPSLFLQLIFSLRSWWWLSWWAALAIWMNCLMSR